MLEVINFRRCMRLERAARCYGADGRRTGSATTSGNITTFYGADGRRTGSATVTGKR
jgi:hypothetical protein